MEEIKQLDQHEAEQIFELPNSWRDKGRKEGIQEGIGGCSRNAQKRIID